MQNYRLKYLINTDKYLSILVPLAGTFYLHLCGTIAIFYENRKAS